MNATLSLLFIFIGAHIPKSFSLLYIALIWSSLASLRAGSRQVSTPTTDQRLFICLQALVLIFSLAYPFSMVAHGFWQLSGRHLLDIFSAVVLPSWLLWWGGRMSRYHSSYFHSWLFAYTIGALLFVVASLCKTRGLSWWLPGSDPGTLLLAWGNEPSMNIRSIEQNGILAVVLAPLSVWYLLHRRVLAGVVVGCFSLTGILSVVVLSGRLWIVSLILSAIPLIFARLRWLRIFADRSRRFGLRSLLVFSLCAIFLIPLLVLGVSHGLFSRLTSYLCDERFSMYSTAFSHWGDLAAGGRSLRFEYLNCDGHTLIPYSAAGDSTATSAMLHSVLLDVMVSVGGWVVLPLALVAILSIVVAIRFAIRIVVCERCGISLPGHQILWSFVSVLVPQWLFQPLLYGDGILFYLSFAAIGAMWSACLHPSPCRVDEAVAPV